MLVDNFLGIYKTSNGDFIGRECWSECNKDHCNGCINRIIFKTRFVEEAEKLAEEACSKGDYEYGYRFLNFPYYFTTPINDSNTERYIKLCAAEENAQNKGEDKMKLFWIIFVDHTDGGRHFRHETLESAQLEASRLAKLPENVGKNVYVFECIGRCKIEEKPIKWEIP